jgi:hypothetical protein
MGRELGMIHHFGYYAILKEAHERNDFLVYGFSEIKKIFRVLLTL